jgi:hypothetical protein
METGGTPLPAGWEEQRSRGTGEVYWYNTSTGLSTWERPMPQSLSGSSAPAPAAAGSQAYPAEWGQQVSNLTARFQENTQDEIIRALREAGGRGGAAAAILMGRPVVRTGGGGRGEPGTTQAVRVAVDAQAAEGVPPERAGRGIDGQARLLHILTTSRVLRGALPDVRRRVLAETIRGAVTVEAATDILLENVASSPYLPQERKDPLAELTMLQQFDALAVALKCDERLACLAPTTPEEEFRALRQMVVAIFTRSRKMQALPAAKRRQLGAAIHTQQTADDIKMLALSALETSQAFDSMGRDLVANDIFDSRYDRLLLPDRFDCDEEPRLASHVVESAGGAATQGARRAEGDGDATAPLNSIGTSASGLAEEAQDCPVCLGTSPISAQLPCGHQFCRECIEGWAQRCPAASVGCPLCRAQFSVADISASCV